MKSFQLHAGDMNGRLAIGTGMAASMHGLPAIGNASAPVNTISVLNGGKAIMAGVWTAVDGNAANAMTTVAMGLVVVTATMMACKIVKITGRTTRAAIERVIEC